MGGLVQGLRGWGGVVCVCCESGFFCGDGKSSYLCIVLSGYLLILGAPSIQSCCTLSISTSEHVFIACIYLAVPAIQRVSMAGLPKKRAGGVDINCTGFDRPL